MKAILRLLLAALVLAVPGYLVGRGFEAREQHAEEAPSEEHEAAFHPRQR